MRPYLLLTPGPLTTSETVKEAMMSDWCTWDEDYNLGIVEVIRKELVKLASSRPEECREAEASVWNLYWEQWFARKIICWLQPTVLMASVWE